MPSKFSLPVDTDALRVVCGLLLIAFVTLTTVKHLAVTYLPSWSRLGNTGTGGALGATVMFAIGSYLVVTGLFRGIERAVESADTT